MRTLVLLAFLIGCPRTDRSPDPTPSATPPSRIAAGADAGVVAVDAGPAPLAAAIFTCERYQTYCGGIDRYVAVCRARDAAGTFVVPFGMGRDLRFAAATYRAVAARMVTIDVRTCAGDWKLDVTVDAEAVAYEAAQDLPAAAAALARLRRAP